MLLVIENDEFENKDNEDDDDKANKGDMKRSSFLILVVLFNYLN
jgi:hypothetical protein